MPDRWRWPALLAGLVLVGVGLAWVDSSLFQVSVWLPGPRIRGLGPGPTTGFREAFRPEAPPLFWLLLTNGVVLCLLALAALTLFPGRSRVAVERLEAQLGPAVALAAGLATLLLFAAAGFLLRFSLFFPAVLPVLLTGAILAATFGLGAVSLAVGRWLRRRMGETAPLLAALAGVLVIFDLGLVPYAGWVALGVFLLAGLGLAVITRFGSAGGWTLEELTW